MAKEEAKFSFDYPGSRKNFCFEGAVILVCGFTYGLGVKK